MQETIGTLEWALNSLGWFLDHAGSKDHVDRWHEAYDPKGAMKAGCSVLAKLKEEKKQTHNIGIDELKKIIIKQGFLLDKIMSVCIDAGVAVNSFSEHGCRSLLKDIYIAWCEVSDEARSIFKIIDELEREDMVKRMKKQEETWRRLE